MIDKDLFGDPIKEPSTAKAVRKKTKASGYIRQPGTGPDGETCGTCKHRIVRYYSKRYHKCGLFIAGKQNTHGVGSDIRVRSPACSKWEPDEEE